MGEHEGAGRASVLRGLRITKPDSLTERKEGLDPYPLESMMAHFRLVESVLVDIERYGDVLTAKLDKESGMVGKIKALYEHAVVLSQIEKATRTANGVKRLIGVNDGDSGAFRKACHENVKHPDHGRKHERNFKKGMKWLLMHKNELFMTESEAFSLRQEKKNASRLDQMKVAAPYVLMRVGDTHDEPQLHAAIWNDGIDDKNKHLRPKDLHELFAGLLAVLDENKYSDVRGYDDGRARLIGNMLLHTTVGHGEPTTYLDSTFAIEKAYSKTADGAVEIPDEELFALVTNKTLDWSSISRSQYLKIIQHSMETGRADNSVRVFDTPSGLHPLLHDHFEQNGGFEKMRNDHTPMFEDITEEEREVLFEMRRMVLVVDLGEMVLPPIEAANRKVIVKKAEERHTWQSINPDGSSFDTEKYLEQLLRINGHDCKSDFERTFFEEFQYLKIVNDCGLLDEPSTKRIFSELLVDAFCGAYWSMNQMMNPDLNKVQDSLRVMFNVQVFDLISKAIVKTGSTVRPKWSDVVDRGWLVETSDELLRRFSSNFSETSYEDLKKRVHNIQIGQDKTIRMVTHKWKKIEYTEVERENARLLFLEMAREFASQLEIPEEIIFKKFDQWQNGDLFENIRRSKLPWVSTGVYMGAPEDAKVI